MQNSEAAVTGQRLPVSLLTGFLGSGKTTVLNHLVNHPGMARTVVIINEFGEIGLDHELVETSAEDMILLQSGCLCCTIRGDLIDTLRKLFMQHLRGEMPAFERVVIETTGLADPAPILHTLMTDPLLAARFRLDGVITTVDAATGASTLDRQIESVKQAAMADRLLLTKTDLMGQEEAWGLESRLRALNPAAPIIWANHGNVDPAVLFDAGLYNPETKSLDVRRWLNAEAYEAPSHGGGHDHHHHEHHTAGNLHALDHHGEEKHGADHHHHQHDVNRHDDHIKAVCFTLEKPIPGDALDRWLEILLMLKGPDVLRVKGIVNVAGLPGPLVIHGVQHIFHPPVALPNWPSKDRRTRIVFITRDVDEALLRDTFKLFTGRIVDEQQPVAATIDAMMKAAAQPASLTA